jgi:hypothetical protein
LNLFLPELLTKLLNVYVLTEENGPKRGLIKFGANGNLQETNLAMLLELNTLLARPKG